MQFCTPAGGSSPSTTTSRNHEDKQNEKESVGERTEVCALRGAIRHSIWLCGHALVELVDAGSVRLAID
jgi:hypothetical protein